MTLKVGNCLEELKTLDDSIADVIYLDPPFFTQKEHQLKTRDNLKEFKFVDKWTSLEEYLNFMDQVIKESNRILKKTGSVFLHCDKSASHHLRILLDKSFGSENFRSEIVWCYKRWSNSKKGLLNSHQTIYFYSKSQDFKFNMFYDSYSPTTNVDQILQERMRAKNGKTQYKRDKNGEIVNIKDKKGVPLSDVWFIPYLNPKAHERSGYPTQKPILLLERIIQLTTNEGDLVLDPFCGSGTTIVTAKMMNRQFIGIDISPDSISLTKQRLKNLVKTKSNLLERGEGDYINKNKKEFSILDSIDAIPVQRNSGIDGFLKAKYLGELIPIKIQREDETIQEALNKLLKSGKSKKYEYMILIRTNHNQQSFHDSFECENDHVLIMNSYDLFIEDWVKLNKLSVSTSFSLQKEQDAISTN
jgi:site-specific DNA-methyltransferase (adenine-specific)